MDNGVFGRSGGPGEPRKPTPARTTAERRPGGGIRWGWILSGILLAIIIIPSLLSDMITDWMWFDSQNLAAVYTTRLWLSVGVFFGAAVLAAVFCWINWSVAWRGARPDMLYSGQREPLSRGVTRAILITSAAIVGLFMGLVASAEWSTMLLYVNSVPFGQTDPLFNNDVGFYVFGLPFYRLLQGWMLVLLIIAAIGAGVIYFLASGLSQLSQQFEEVQRGVGSKGTPGRVSLKFNVDKRIGTHLSILGAIFLFLLAFGYWFDRFDLLYSSRAVSYGAGYTDVNAKLPALYIMMVVAGLAGVLLLANIWVRTWKLLLGALGVWLVALILVGGVYPAVIQSFVVKPSEQSLEKPYIENNIAATRLAFSLDKMREREVPVVASINRTQVDENRTIIDDIRLWDYRPLLDTFSQLQLIRSYYSFGVDPNSIDIDRYQIDGKSRQVMIAARELTTSQLNAQAKTWQNQHLVYTHGYGAVAASVNEIEGEGLPQLLLKNVPPETDIPSLKITRPEIYYGEQTDDYAFVNTNTPEFDYPQGDQTKYTSYQGKGGVRLSNVFTKLLFAVRFGDGNVMLSSSITPESRVLFHRNIKNAVRLLAPFLSYDSDPYIVVSEGQLYWIQDAYTTSDRYPYSTPYDPSGLGDQAFNYIRNSVKVVISAYDGSATFYVSDSTDPIVKAYRGIFPALFKDMSEMTADLRSHIRYPEGLMNIQAQMYATYHITDPQVFYNREDVWTVPFGTQSETSAALQAYYTNMTLPGETNVSFKLILPFTPVNRDNMIAWMAADSDGENYGRVDIIRYPKQQLVYGPKQIEARIDQDPIISQQLTLWNASGSNVLRGNLLIIPISNTVLYVEPLFLQSTSSNSSIPELKRVIVATGDRVGIGADLDAALDVALGAAPPPPITGGSGGANPTPVPGATPRPGTTPSLLTPAALTESALEHYGRAQNSLREGDWATYGREIDAMKADLDQLALLTGAVTPVPSPSPPTTSVTPTP